MFQTQHLRPSVRYAGSTVWNSLPDFIRDPAFSTDYFRRLLKTYFSLDISASSALGVLDDYALYKSIYLLTKNLNFDGNRRQQT